MSSPFIAPGARVRCLTGELERGPEYGWTGTIMAVETEDGLFIPTIAWDALRGNRAQRRRGESPLHVWAFQSVELAGEFLEVISAGPGGNA